MATLSLTHMVPNDNLNCGLDQKWDRLFRSKDGARIRRIQDTHQCCGLHSILDRAWPFQNRNHGVNECANAFNRTKACLGGWRRDQQIAAGLLLLVAISTFLLKVSGLPLLGVLHQFNTSFGGQSAQRWLNSYLQLIILFLVRTRSSWLHRSIWGNYSALPGGDPGHREIEPNSEYPGHDHRRIEGPYRDNPILESVDEEPGSERETVNNAYHNAENRQINQGPVLQPSRLIETDDAWREDGH